MRVLHGYVEAERSAVLCIEEAKAGLGGPGLGGGQKHIPCRSHSCPWDTWESRLGGDKEEC